MSTELFRLEIERCRRLRAAEIDRKVAEAAAALRIRLEGGSNGPRETPRTDETT